MDKVSLGTAEALIRHNQALQEVAEQMRRAARDVIPRALTLRLATQTIWRRVAKKTLERSYDG